MIPSSQSRSASPSSSSSSPSPSPSLTTQTTKQKRKDITSVPKKTISPKKNSRKKKRGIFDPDFSTASENGDGQDEVGDNDVRGDKAKDQADFGWAMFERARLNDDGLVKVEIEAECKREKIDQQEVKGYEEVKVLLRLFYIHL
ncbi:hypothetical protein G9A89_014487 [Geosiphon pyriformis]|nr:hypothetical protein G9A89_014487 [Geosiphon pyriformis]